MTHEQRRHFRIKYPVQSRAQLEIEFNQYPIVDISHSGFKFIGGKKFAVGFEFTGSIQFCTGDKIKIKGSVVRIVGDLVMVSLSGEISLKVLENEAQCLIQKFGKVDSAPVHR
jgi:hypothetical protein